MASIQGLVLTEGTPILMVSGKIFLVTTAPAPTIEPFPMFISEE